MNCNTDVTASASTTPQVYSWYMSAGTNCTTDWYDFKALGRKEKLKQLIKHAYKAGIRGWKCRHNRRTNIWYGQITVSSSQRDKLERIARQLGFVPGIFEIKGHKAECPCRKY